MTTVEIFNFCAFNGLHFEKNRSGGKVQMKNARQRGKNSYFYE